MPISTYAELKTAVTNWAKRGDIGSEVETFIDLAEADMWQGPAIEGAQPLRIRDMQARATATASTTDRFLALPDSYLEMRKLRFYTASQNYPLDCVVPESQTVLTGSGIPSNYTITSQIEFNQTASSAFTVEMHYYKQLTALSSSQTTSQILTRFPSVYLYGCLFHFANWALNDAMVAKYGALFSNAIKQANKTDKKGRYGAAKSMRVETSTP